MKTKLILLLALLALCCCGAWATVTQPTLTTDVDNPVYYTIKNFRSSKYAAYAGPTTQLSQVSSITKEALWYFVENSDGVYIVPAVDPTVKLVSNVSADATGAKWYLVENPHKSGYFCVTLSSTASSKCWDDNSSHTGVGYWQPSSTDNQGTSWIIESSATTLAEVIDYRRSQILPAINALPEVLKPSAKMTALNNAATDATFRAAVADFSANVTFLCRSGKYLEVGEAQGSFNSSKTDNAVIQLESVGDGTFYIKGYVSMKYMGDVAVSTAIQTEVTANIPYYIQTVTVNDVKYAVARPTKYSDSGWDAGYHYIHNGGSGCVGWDSSEANTQFTIETSDLPSGYCVVTYNIDLNDEVIVSESVRQATSSSSAVPSKYVNDYTSYSYDVAAIPNANSATIKATATVSGLPFTISTDYENATWYYMQLHSSWNYYVSTNEYAIAWASGSQSSNKYYWAFMGNPIQGFKIINRATGNSYYLTATDPATMSTTEKTWNLKKKDATHFGLWDAIKTYANGQSSTIKYWGSFDEGSTFWVTEVSADEIEFVDDIAKLESYSYGNGLGQYSFTGKYAGYHGNETSIISELKSAGYSAANLTIAGEMLEVTAINQPTGKFVRFYNAEDARYWGISASSGYTTTENDIANAGIFYINNISSENHILNYQNGLYTANSTCALSAAVGNLGGAVTFSESATRGKYYIYNGGYQVSWLNNDNGFHINRLSSLSDSNKPYGTWEILPVESLPVTISSVGYATFYAPVALEIPAEVTAYVATDKGDYISLTAIEGGIIPANTGVILAGDEGSYSFNITTGGSVGSNALTGTVAAIARPVDSYVLATGEHGVALYKDGATKIPGFKAYLAAPSGGSVKAFRFEDDETGINGCIPSIFESEDAAIYNMAGQRVSKLQKGVNIVNGKKVLF